MTYLHSSSPLEILSVEPRIVSQIVYARFADGTTIFAPVFTPSLRVVAEMSGDVAAQLFGGIS